MKCIKLLITGRIITYFLVGSQVTKRGNTVYRTRQTILIYLSLSLSLSPIAVVFIVVVFFLSRFIAASWSKDTSFVSISFQLSSFFLFFYNLFYAIGDTVRCNEDSLLFTRCQRYFLCQSSFARIQIFIYFAHKKFIACIL